MKKLEKQDRCTRTLKLDQINFDFPVNDVVLSQLNQRDPTLKTVAKNLISENYEVFSSLLAGPTLTDQKRKIERVYSRNEIKDLVSSHLIAVYQHDQIIDAVTDLLYDIHVSH